MATYQEMKQKILEKEATILRQLDGDAGDEYDDEDEEEEFVEEVLAQLNIKYSL